MEGENNKKKRKVDKKILVLKRLKTNTKKIKKKIKKVINHHPYIIAFSIFILICAIILYSITYLFFFSPSSNPKGTDTLSLWIDIGTSDNIELECQYCTVNYSERYITIGVNLKRVTKYSDDPDKLYFEIDPYAPGYDPFQMSKKLCEKTQLTVGHCRSKSGEITKSIYREEIKINLRKSTLQGGYFDIHKLFDGTTSYCYVEVELDENIFPRKYERTIYKSQLKIDAYSKFSKDITFETIFPNNFEISSYFPQAEKSFLKNKGKYWILVGSNDPHEISLDAEVTPDYSKIGLRNTKLGIIISVLFALVSMLLTITIYLKNVNFLK
jgi:hypothetical protein